MYQMLLSKKEKERMTGVPNLKYYVTFTFLN